MPLPSASPHVPVLENASEEWASLREKVLSHGIERMRADVQRLKDLGIVDEDGNSLQTDLPLDMRPGAKRDFGG